MDKLTNDQLKDELLKALSNVGDLIKTTRKSKDLKIADLSKLAGVSSSVISDLETHKGVMPNISTLVVLANSLDLPADTFINLMFVNINGNSTSNNLGKLEKIQTALSEYGLPPVCMNRVLDYVDYFVSVDKIQDILKNPPFCANTTEYIEKLERIKKGIRS